MCLIAGMAGSQQGWLEAPYCPCPAGFDDIAAQLAWVPTSGGTVGHRVGIVPGLCMQSSAAPDVMRGEETQVFGALQLLGLDFARLVLPGTHSKWVTVTDRRVTDFSTWMTGEFYALLRQHSILARTMPAAEPELDANAFEQGVALALGGRGLLHTAFSARALALFKRINAKALPSYLSGLLIGEELKGQILQRSDTVVLIGSPALAARYELALAQLGVQVQQVGSSATWCGLRAIANTLESK